MKTICLTMIVKNESAIIERCLHSVKDLVDYWVICDTGSTDNTPEIIASVMQDVPGELHRQAWVDFSHNRNQALEISRDKADYCLLVDADYVVNVHGEFKNRLTADSYLIRDDGPLDYQRDLLISNQHLWAYVGATHEYIRSKTARSREKLPEITITHHSDGGMRSEKFTRDIELLTKGLQEDPDNARYMFYLAQSYRDIGDFSAALHWYDRRIEAGGWSEEVWYARYQAAKMRDLLELDWSEVGESYLKAYVDRPTRFEPLYEIARHHRKNRAYELGFAFSQMVMNMPYPKDVLFVHKEIYEYKILLENAICAHHLGKYKAAIKTYDKVLKIPNLPVRVRELALENRDLSLEKVDPAASVSNLGSNASGSTTRLHGEPWPCQEYYDVLGIRVLVQTNSAKFSRQARNLLRCFSSPPGGVQSPDVTLSFEIKVESPKEFPSESPREADGVACHVYRDGALVGYTRSYGKLFQLLEWQFTWCADQVDDFLLLHSGAVGKNGAAILMPGASKRGKSSLTLALLERGYDYFSDEIAAINPLTTKVHAFPRALGIRDASIFPGINLREELFAGPHPDDQEPVWWVHPKEVAAKPSARLRPHITPVKYIHPDDIWSAGNREPVPGKFIIFPKYDPRSAPTLQPLTSEEAMQRLVRACRNLNEFGGQSLHLFAAVAEAADCYSLKSNNLKASVDIIDGLVGC